MKEGKEEKEDRKCLDMTLQKKGVQEALRE